MAKRVRDGITTSQLLTVIRGASSFQEAVAYHETAPEPRFHETLYELMEKKGLSTREMIRRTGVERSYFYQVMKGKRNPGRDKVLRLCLAAGLGLKETTRALELSGNAMLYPRRRRDIILTVAINQKAGVDDTNLLLFKYGEEPLE